MSKKKTLLDEQRFIADLVALLAPWGMPITAARLYGYLLLKEEPVSLEQIAADLAVSKSNACSAAKLLEKHSNARRYLEPGTRRVLYGASDEFATLVTEQSRMLGAIGKMLKKSATGDSASVARKRLTSMGEFYISLGKAMTETIEKLEDELHLK